MNPLVLPGWVASLAERNGSQATLVQVRFLIRMWLHIVLWTEPLKIGKDLYCGADQGSVSVHAHLGDVLSFTHLLHGQLGAARSIRTFIILYEVNRVRFIHHELDLWRLNHVLLRLIVCSDLHWWLSSRFVHLQVVNFAIIMPRNRVVLTIRLWVINLAVEVWNILLIDLVTHTRWDLLVLGSHLLLYDLQLLGRMSAGFLVINKGWIQIGRRGLRRIPVVCWFDTRYLGLVLFPVGRWQALLGSELR